MSYSAILLEIYDSHSVRHCWAVYSAILREYYHITPNAFALTKHNIIASAVFNIQQSFQHFCPAQYCPNLA